MSVWEPLLRFDEALLLSVRRWESVAMTRVMRKLTRLGDATSWVVVGLAFFAAGGPVQRYGALLALGAFFSVTVSQVLKRVCCRKRPDRGIVGFAALAENPDAFSFPSGHTAAAFGIAVALTGEGSWLGALSLSLASGIAVSRVYLGAHYPLDVACGALLGTGCGLAARMLVYGVHGLTFLG
jgi:undecaprenyl-diphosphatase